MPKVTHLIVRTPGGSFTVVGTINDRPTRAECRDGLLRIDPEVAIRARFAAVPKQTAYSDAAGAISHSIVGTVLAVMRAMDSVTAVTYGPLAEQTLTSVADRRSTGTPPDDTGGCAH